MTGIEYRFIHGQDPILYVIRKQMRHSPTQGAHSYFQNFYVQGVTKLFFNKVL